MKLYYYLVNLFKSSFATAIPIRELESHERSEFSTYALPIVSYPPIEHQPMPIMLRSTYIDHRTIYGRSVPQDLIETNLPTEITFDGKTMKDIQKMEIDLKEKDERIQYLEFLLANDELKDE